MGKIIAVANQKGGVGKTTTCVNLTCALKKRGRRVLLVDCDPQGNSTSGMGVDKTATPNCYDMLMNGAAAADCIRSTKYGDVLPANMNLSGCSVELVGSEQREYIMKTALAAVQGDYDFILIDCPPSLELLTINALVAADSVLIPVQCEYYALEGIADLMRSIKMCNKRLNPALTVQGIVMTMYDSRTKLSDQVVNEVRKFFGKKVYKTMIPRNVRLSEAPSHRKPAIAYDKESKGARAYLHRARKRRQKRRRPRPPQRRWNMGKDGKKGLGMGLGALFGEEYPAPQPEREETAPDLLPIEKIEPRADQPRKHFDPEALEMLAESIRTYGLIQPITVRPLEGGFYQIIAGERRWRASRMAGLKEVPVRILTADEQRAMEMALVENLQREDLNPIEEAKGYRALQDVYGMTQDDVAQSVGKSRPAVANATRLLALSEPVLKLVEDGTLSAGHARALLPLGDPEMQLAAAKTVIEKGLSVRRAEALAAQLLKDMQEKPVKKPAGVDYLGECARHLEQVLGRKVRMTQGRKTGRIELEYYDADDREALLQALEAIGRRN